MNPLIRQNKIYTVLGMMSGTSLDGVDLSLANYRRSQQNQQWTFQMVACKTYSYQQEHVDLIKQMEKDKIAFLQFHKKQLQYSQIIVQFITQFLQQFKQKIVQNSYKINFHNKKLQNIVQSIDLIGYHGHTIFHNPSQLIAIQIGNLAYLVAKLKINVVGKFRQFDVCCGGQGAPLAPYGEELFCNQKKQQEKGNTDSGLEKVELVYLNLGGIANIGYQKKGYDIVFCNMVLNAYSRKISGKQFDEDGKLGQKAQIDENHLKWLYSNITNKNNQSLSREQAQQYLQEIKNSPQPNQVLIKKMRAYYQFTASQIKQQIVNIVKSKHENAENAENKDKLLINVYCTGGGAYNTFLISLLNKKLNISESHTDMDMKFVLPAKQIVEFKQSLIFGLLAVKFIEGEKNCENGIGGYLVKGNHRP